MIFEFLITCDKTQETDIREVIAESLIEASSDFDESMVQVRHERPVRDVSGAHGNTIVGFSLDLPEYATSDQIADFTEKLLESPQVFHVVKFEDPLLRQYLDERAAEIFALEMKLRRVISLIYLNAYRLVGPFNLLRGDQVNPNPEGRNAEQRMQQLSENHFFFVEFSDYARLNNTPNIGIANILDIIKVHPKYSGFHDEIEALSRRPITEVEDIDLLSKLKDERITGSITKMRNCVAHNRHPTPDEIREYDRALPQLKELLDEYLARWATQELTD